jgi:hypothetical protein
MKRETKIRKERNIVNCKELYRSCSPVVKKDFVLVGEGVELLDICLANVKLYMQHGAEVM